ncbi:MAG TPA: RNA-binding protein [Polyangia bacterium]|jgi:RNA recognition motif-containing protein
MATGTRLYVGNLSFGTTESALRAAFEQGGRKVAEVKIVTDRDTGQPRGFAFVEMASPADAQAAMAEWNGQELDGRTLKVNEAQERSGGGGGGGGRGGGGDRGGYGGGGRGGRGGRY